MVAHTGQYRGWINHNRSKGDGGGGDCASWIIIHDMILIHIIILFYITTADVSAMYDTNQPLTDICNLFLDNTHSVLPDSGISSHQ